jgi:hypothetical protein
MTNGKVTTFRLTPGVATERINALANDTFNIGLTVHAKKQMELRGVVIGDVFQILQHGSVEREPVKGNKGEWKCNVERKIKGQRVAVVVTAIVRDELLEVITVMWKDGS